MVFTMLRYHVSHAYDYRMQGWSYIALVPASLGVENATRFLGCFTFFGWSSDRVRLVMIAVVSRLGGYVFRSVDDWKKSLIRKSKARQVSNFQGLLPSRPKVR